MRTRMKTNSRFADGAPVSSAPSLHGSRDGRLLPDEDQDTGDLPAGVDEDVLNEDPLDTDRVAAED